MTNTICVLDFETTGLDPEACAICEIGRAGIVFDIFDGRWVLSYHDSALCDPGHPIPAIASAVHHITDEMVQGAMPWFAALGEMIEDGAQLAAHNEKFDRSFTIEKDVPWLCTMRLAMEVYPDAPSYKNQVLRYWLKLALPEEIRKMPAHSAHHDAVVTALLLCKMLNEGEVVDLDGQSASLKRLPYRDLVAIAQRPKLLKGVLGFGKYHDLTWAEVADKDLDYFRWMIREDEATLRKTGEHAWERDQVFTIDHYLRHC